MAGVSIAAAQSAMNRESTRTLDLLPSQCRTCDAGGESN